MEKVATIGRTSALISLVLAGFGQLTRSGDVTYQGHVTMAVPHRAHAWARISPTGSLRRVRATVSSGAITSVGRCPCSLFEPSEVPAIMSSRDSQAVEVGVKFRADVNGFVGGIRYYKGANNSGTHVGHLWSNSGKLLAGATFSNETASGWQQLLFARPVPVSAGTIYVASYHTNMGHYADTPYAFTRSLNRGALHVPSSAAVNGNGVYAYGAERFPIQSYHATNYWVDVIFNTQPAGFKRQVVGARAAPRWVNISPPQVSTAFNHPLNNYGFQAIAIDPVHVKTLYVGTCYQGVWKTTNGGKTWFKVNTGTNGRILNTGRLWSLAIDRFHPQTLYAANGYGFGQGVWKSTDGGVDWQQTLPGTSPIAQRTSQDVHTIATDPYRSGHILVTFHGGWNTMGGRGGILESVDGGTTWIIHQPLPSWGAGQSIHFLDNGATWLLGTQTDGLWRTADSGHTWTRVTHFGRADGPWGIYHARNGVWYAGGQYRILRSADDGRTWTAVGPDPGTGSYYTVIGDGRNVYAQAATSFGNPTPTSYISAPEASGTNWTPYNDQAFKNGPLSMAYDPVNHIVYSSNGGAGVWKLPVESVHP